jgi:filamentous hemagglutinin
MDRLNANFRIARTVAAILALAQGATGRQTAEAATLPVPCIANTCIANKLPGKPSQPFVTSGNATATQVGNTLTVNQTSANAILNWQSFNISADGSVRFQQPASSSVALNRIYQQSPSSIFGSLSANGQVYLVNPNGIVFGKTATVNVGGIIASSLGISDAHFNAGLLSPSILGNPDQTQRAAFSAADNTVSPVAAADGTTNPGNVTVAAGAQISTQGGRILLAGTNVSNAGTLTAPDGQIVLAAGQKIYLQANTDQSLRGLIVEVDQGGTAENELSGVLSSDRGNVSMIGLAVNQNGHISATTAVSANGSVRLEAADNVSVQASGNTTTIAATMGGTLELGAQSSIDIEPELSSTATTTFDPHPADGSAPVKPLPSIINLTGEKILMDGASIEAPAGELNVNAVSDPSVGIGTGAQNGANRDPNAEIRVNSGTTIDLSGIDFEQPMAANLLAIQLRSNELADDPTQRGGPLQGQTVYVDVRTAANIGVIGATALDQTIAAIPRTIGFFSTTGGSVNFQSGGDVVFAQGSSINVSGGKTIYDAGVMQTTQLIGANGRLYDIDSANPLLSYTGVLNPTFTTNFDKWGIQEIIATPGLGHYQTGYIQGSSAGEVEFAAPAMLFGGTLAGSAVNGPYQRSGSSVAQGATLIIGEPGGIVNSSATRDFLSPTITVTNQMTPVAIQDGYPLLEQQAQLPASYLTSDGFTNTQIYGDSTVTIAAGTPLGLLPGFSLTVDAPRVNVFSNIVSPGGSITLESVQSQFASSSGIGRLGVDIGDGITFDVRGEWINDSTILNAATAPMGLIYQNGGTINISLQDDPQGVGVVDGAELVIGNNVSLRASGGAWLSRANALTGGTGGSITLGASPLDAAMQIGSNVELDAYGVNGAIGGSFSLTAPRISIASGGAGGAWSGAQRVDDLNNPGGVLTLDPSLFLNYGFSSVALTATGPVDPKSSNMDALIVQAGTQIYASSQTLMINPGYLMRPDAANIDGLATLTTLPLYARNGSSVLLEVLPKDPDPSLSIPGLIDIQAGASITTDPNNSASIALEGSGGIYVDGTLRSQGGTITLETLRLSAGSQDPGYRPDLALELGSKAVIDVSGTVVYGKPSDLGYLPGSVLNAGTIALFADRGTLVADTGSTLDLAGGSGVLDIPTEIGSGRYSRYTVGSSGGVLSVRSPESVSLLGTMEAGAGAGNYGDPTGGELDLDISQLSARGWFQGPAGGSTVPLPNPDAMDIQIVDSTSGMPASTPDSGKAVLGVSQLESDGFDSLTLFAGSKIEISASTPMNFARQVVLDSPMLQVDNQVNASVNANYVALADSQPLQTSTAVVQSLQSGSGALTVQAQQIDLIGSIAVAGAHKVTLESAGDIQLEGVSIESALPVGGLTINGNLELDAARIYPSTFNTYNITALGTGNRITIGQTNASPGTPLSAEGTINLQADEIDTSGTLIAPFGVINLQAQTQLNLQPGSVTSVSGAGATIPFGATDLNGQEWIYTGGGFVPLTISAIPQRLVTLNAPNVSIASGATVDLQGGGDLYAYEWVPGTGGTKDVLGPTPKGTTAPVYYAVLPSMLGQFAPYDAQYQSQSVQGTAPGESIYLSAAAGLAAGFYPLLPSRYALLPGAFLVELEPTGYTNIVPGQKAALADGTTVVAGYQTFGTTGLHSGGYEGIAVWPGSYSQQLAQYQDSYASSFFATLASNSGSPTPNLPTDAGQLSISVDESLNLAGTVLTKPFDSKGKGAVVDISAPILEITQETGGAVTQTGAVGVGAGVIDGWHVGELVLGGHPHLDSNGNSVIDVNANQVTVDSGVQLSADEVLAVANQSIELQSKASILSSSALPGGSAPTQMPQLTPISLVNVVGSGSTTTTVAATGAALLGVSDLALPVVSRDPTAGIANPGTITLDSNSTIGTLGAISIDAPGRILLGGNLQGKGASWSLASSSIGFVKDQDNSNPDTLQITSGVQSELASAAAIRLSSLSSIDFYTSVQLGSQSPSGDYTLSSLTLSAATINNLSPGASSSLSAHNIDLQGIAVAASSGSGTGAGSAPSVPGSGMLTFNVSEFDLGVPPPDPTQSIQAVTSYPVSVSGFGKTLINASNSFVAQGTYASDPATGAIVSGTGAGLLNDGDLEINAGVVTAANGTLAQIQTTGTLTLSGGGATSVLSTYLGGELDFSADTINQSGNIVVPAGIVSMTATHDINLSGTAQINTSGTVLNIAGQSVGAEGGRILLSAGAYNGSNAATVGGITIGTQAGLSASGASDPSLSGSGSNPIGGLIQLTATGQMDLSGGLQAQPGTGAAQAGRLVVDAGSLKQGLDDLTGKSGALESGGFGKEISIRTRTGDLQLSAGNTLTSNQVSLTADSGAVDIGGTISAPAADTRGQIQLFGATAVNVSGRLNADAAGSAGVGGDIELGTGANGAVSLLSGSVISARGAAGSGTLTVRAPLINGNTNIAVTDTGSNLSGLGEIAIEPVITEAATTGGSSVMQTSDYSRIQSDVAGMMSAAAGNISSSLNQGGTLSQLVVRPAVDVVQNGDLTINSSLNLATTGWRFGSGDQPVDLTFRASGTITVNTMISDGFQQVMVPKANGVGNITTTGLIQNNPDGTVYDSASISLVAGADTGSVNPLAIVAGSQGSLNITDGAHGVRTGTGNINLVASQDIQFGAGAEVYTAGRAGSATVAMTPADPASTSVFNFPVSGGNITVNAGRDVSGVPVPDYSNNGINAGPSPSTWQLYQAGTSTSSNPQWGVDLAAYGTYGWDVGSLGGGDVNITAGRDVSTLSAAASDSYAAASGNAPAKLFSSGGLAVDAGRNIGSSEFYAADGTSILNAGGAFNAVLQSASSNNLVGSLIALNTAQVYLNARLGAVIDGVVNPTLLTQLAQPAQTPSFSSYGSNSALNVQATAGSIAFGDELHTLLGQVASGGVGGDATGQIYPATLEAFSLSQDISLSSATSLFPSSTGQLELIAGRDISSASADTPLVMSDAFLTNIPTIANPGGTGPGNPWMVQAAGDLHSSDPTPAVVAAGRDISSLNVSVPKATDIFAGRDIVDLRFYGQNLNSNDVTLISAGRDFIDTTFKASSGNSSIVLPPNATEAATSASSAAIVQVGGPGSLDLLAGRNIDLGLSHGITTTGSLNNPNLPMPQGANLTVMAGLGKGADYADFMNDIVVSDSANQELLTSFVEQTNSETGLTFSQALTQFGQLSTIQQSNFLNQIFFDELEQSGQEANSVGYGRGYAAIDALFPNSRTAVASGPSPYQGDISLTFSQIYTLSGGTISLFAPGGGLNVGLAVQPPNITVKPPSQLGIVAEGPGDVDIYTKNDVLVNSSRIFTLGGGNLLAWSDEGNIDAGRGAKSSTSAPPPQILVDAQGNITLNFEGAVSGSGIRTIQAEPDVPPGNVELVAPAGTINAGDAGIGAAGNITLAALHVLGVDNIQFGGTAVGVPAVVSNIGVTLAGVSNVASSSTNNAQNVADEAAKRAAAQDAPQATAAISWLDVFVSGLGEENCKPDDMDCLKRQKKD